MILPVIRPIEEDADKYRSKDIHLQCLINAITKRAKTFNLFRKLICVSSHSEVSL